MVCYWKKPLLTGLTAFTLALDRQFSTWQPEWFFKTQVILLPCLKSSNRFPSTQNKTPIPKHELQGCGPDPCLSLWPHLLPLPSTHSTPVMPASRCSSNIPSSLQPQGLCTSYFLCLEHSPDHRIAHSLTSFIYSIHHSSDRPFLTILSKIGSWSFLVFLSCFNFLHITYYSLGLYYIIICSFIICVP